MSLSRRQFIQAAGLALGAGSLPLRAQASSTQQPQLPVPPLLESRRGQPLFLTLQRAHWALVAIRKPQCGELTACIWGRRSEFLMVMTLSSSTATG